MSTLTTDKGLFSCVYQMLPCVFAVPVTLYVQVAPARDGPEP